MSIDVKIFGTCDRNDLTYLLFIMVRVNCHMLNACNT